MLLSLLSKIKIKIFQMKNLPDAAQARGGRWLQRAYWGENDWGGGTKSRVKRREEEWKKWAATGPWHSTLQVRGLQCSCSLLLASTRSFFLILRHGHILPPSRPPPPPLFPFSFSSFQILSPYFHPVLPTPSFTSSLSCHSSPLLSSPVASPSLSPSIPLTLSSLQLPEELSNNLNETPAAFIFNSPPCWIPKRTQPCTAIRKTVPAAAAFAMSAWRSSLPPPRTGRALHKVGSTASTGTEVTAESQEGFAKPASSLPLSSCPPPSFWLPAHLIPPAAWHFSCSSWHLSPFRAQPQS